MERLESTSPLYRALSVMAADPQSPLDRDERYAIVCWLTGVESNVLILLPHDVADKLVLYISAHAPELMGELVLPLCAALPYVLMPDFASPLETDFYIEWGQQGLDVIYPLTPQYPIKDGQYRLDFAFPPLMVGIELDGYTYHSDRKSFTRDRKRQREIEAQGWRVLRFSGDEIRTDVVRCVREAAHFLSIQQHRKHQQEDPK